MDGLRRMLEKQIHQLVGFGEPGVVLDRPAGDPGLFGPGSAAWRVHGDFSAMLAGGIAALLLQMLHPAALAGVWDHSRFRDDVRGRLRRTAQFVAGTTYGGTAEAGRLIARVRAIHAGVRGTLPDGTPYAASDPALLTWVHVAEVTSFLAGHLRYREPAMPPAMQDRYLAEMAGLAERLGATDVPRDRRGAAAYLAQMRPRLACDARTREIAAAILHPADEAPAAQRLGALVRAAGVDLLPRWAVAMHGLTLDPLRRSAVRLGMRGAGGVTRWALRDGSSRRAHRQMREAELRA